MSSKAMKQQDVEEHLDYVQRRHYIGRFKVRLNQTKTHPEQRTLDPSWVESLVGEIGDPEILNRASHPIAAMLEDDSMINHLLVALEAAGGKNNNTPDLPVGVTTLVFAGQHRLAMLSQLGFEDPTDLWWHADIYEKELESRNPAEFLTLMHASNVPDVKQPNRDVDLFRAVLKLKGLFESKKINRETFLRNRQTLLGFKKSTSRAISNLTRNAELADAIAEALLHPHIAKAFSAGSWKLLTIGRLYMIAAGLVKEMTAQMSQLTEGTSEVPEEVISFQGRHCYINHIKTFVNGKKKHPWNALPGGIAAALDRVTVRPGSFVSTLNPKTSDPWSLPDVVLIPSCLGSKVVEDELKTVHQVVLHLIKMTCNDEHYDRYTRSNPETLEDSADHPAGMIAHMLSDKHSDSAKLILHAAWKERKSLLEELKKLKVPGVESANADDYKHLLEASRPWWTLLRLYKIHRFDNNSLALEVPREFCPSTKGREESQGIHGEVSVSNNNNNNNNNNNADESGTEQDVENNSGGKYNKKHGPTTQQTATASMTRIESRAVTMVLDGILEAKQRGVLEKLTIGLAGETKRILGQLEQKEHNSIYDTEEEDGESEDSSDTE
ncbi:hypothetical protein RSAG8_09013, partial [Rhizoctonia solani AG-8 WAC10335]